MSLAAAAAVTLGTGLIASPAGHAADDPVNVVVDGNDVRADNVNGLTYKGLGVLSCNSTSNLLMDYKAEHPERYWQLIRMLFGGENPLVNHVKVEMGSDTNTSTGADPATMRTADELADAARSPGFQLAADAKTVNPRLKVSILRWEMPQWVQQEWNKGTGTDEMYRWYKETILDVYEKYGYMVHGRLCRPGQERDPVARHLFHQVVQERGRERHGFRERALRHSGGGAGKGREGVPPHQNRRLRREQHPQHGSGDAQ
ncbi:hypothetical protein AB0M68_20435 [Streptomyces sp. NPDC051453]|uniref:hypothetical protein n=1 Tax=Streptomyces sp. NPDC051453 TaxID=3154941 RepID=UPI0034480CCC